MRIRFDRKVKIFCIGHFTFYLSENIYFSSSIDFIRELSESCNTEHHLQPTEPSLREADQFSNCCPALDPGQTFAYERRETCDNVMAGAGQEGQVQQIKSDNKLVLAALPGLSTTDHPD